MFSKLVDPECNFGEMLRIRFVKIPVKFLLKAFCFEALAILSSADGNVESTDLSVLGHVSL